MIGPIALWQEFTGILHEGSLTLDRIMPVERSLAEPLLTVLSELRAAVPKDVWPRNPRHWRNGDDVIYLVELGTPASTFCFTLVAQGDEWFVKHVESILLPIDSVPRLPASEFPDLPVETKAWMRQEIDITNQIHMYNVLKKERGRELAVASFCDGAGYYLASKAWLPLLPDHQAFIMYMCWEQSVLRGNQVTLEKLDDTGAVVRVRALWFEIYDRALHLRRQIPAEDYRVLFESIWRDRARAAGYDLRISYGLPYTSFEFYRIP